MTRMNWLRLIGLSGAIAVLAGAFGAHGLSGKAAEWARTGASYQLLHLAVALAVLLGAKGGRPHNKTLAMLVGGGWLFAGTLYAMALGAPHWPGAITPIGGVMLVLGWLALLWNARRL